MLRLSRKTLLAVEAVLDIAYHGRAEPVQAREITARQGAPQRSLEHVMQQLVHEGVLRGVRGPKGGYTLARERRRISVGEIVRIVSALDAGDEEDGSASALGKRIVGPAWDGAEAAFLAELDALSIEDLFRQAVADGVPRAGDDAADFAI